MDKIPTDNGIGSSNEHGPERRCFALLTAVIIALVFVAIASIFVIRGDSNADEGFYALISREVMQGKVPYRDLAYTQTPLLPYIQGVAMSVIGFGVAQQRWLNVVFQAFSIALVVYYWRRRRLATPIIIALSLVWCLCLPLLYYGTVGKTYALAQLFLVISSFCVIGPLRPYPALIVLSFCSVLAVGCRLPMAPVVVILWLGFCRIHARNISKTLLSATPLLFALLLLGPFVVVAPGNAYFWTWGLHSQVMFPRAPWATLMQLPLFAPGVTVVAGLGLMAALAKYSPGRFPGLCVLFAGVAGAILNVGASGIYLEYAVPCLVLIILGAGEALVAYPLHWRWQYVGAVLCTSVSVTAFFLQNRNWSVENYLANVAAAGRYIATQSAPEDPLLSSMPELALAAKRPVYPRSEMGKFSVTEEMTPQKAFDRRIMTFAELVFLADHAVPKIIALSRFENWDFRWSIPSMRTVGDEDYKKFSSALLRNYSCTFSNETFLIFTQKTSPAPLIGGQRSPP